MPSHNLPLWSCATARADACRAERVDEAAGEATAAHRGPHAAAVKARQAAATVDAGARVRDAGEEATAPNLNGYHLGHDGQ